jgi:hypothetical protein
MSPGQAGDRHVAAGVVQGRQQPAQGGERVGDRAAVRPAVHAVPQRAHLHRDVGTAAQRGGQRGDAGRPVDRVGEHEHVGTDPAGIGGEEPGQRGRADLLFALHQHGDPDREPVTVGAQRRQVHRDAGLVVGSATAVQAAVPFGRLERVAVPGRDVAGRLHVVVRVQQDRGGAGRPGPVPEHRGLAAARGDHLDLGQPGGAQQRRHLPGAGRQVRRRRRVRRHRRDPDQPLQVGAHRRQHLPDRREKPIVIRVLRGHFSSRAGAGPRRTARSSRRSWPVPGGGPRPSRRRW